MELCPICIDKEATIFTECNHRYCACCISRINKCAMCRKPLLHNKLCKQIKNWSFKNIGLKLHYSECQCQNKVTEIYSNNNVSVFAFAYEP